MCLFAGKLLAPLHSYSTPSSLAAASTALLCLLVADMHISCNLFSLLTFIIGVIVSAIQVTMGVCNPLAWFPLVWVGKHAFTESFSMMIIPFADETLAW